MTRKSRSSKAFWEMSADELSSATREFDREDLSAGEPLSGEMLTRYRRARRKRGRPRRGEGSKVISVSLEKSLLRRTDRLVKKLRTTRAQLIARALERVLDPQ